ncbi:MAG: hypothetical protein HFF18_07935 [Oscillospiraceae bacterium]|nr:hypothetical protein [Oscillospiraceae bacterium]
MLKIIQKRRFDLRQNGQRPFGKRHDAGIIALGISFLRKKPQKCMDRGQIVVAFQSEARTGNLMRPNIRRFCYPCILQSVQKTQAQFPIALHTAFPKSISSAIIFISLQELCQRGFQNDVLSPHFHGLLIMLIQITAVSTL